MTLRLRKFHILLCFLLLVPSAEAFANVKEKKQNLYSLGLKNSISVDPFPVGARGLVFKAEYERVLFPSLSFLVTARLNWIDSENLSYLFESGYNQYEPISLINSVFAAYGAKETVSDVNVLAGVGFKFYPEEKPLHEGFFVKALIGVGFGQIQYKSSANEVVLRDSLPRVTLPTPNVWANSPEDEAQFAKGIGTIVFTPELTVGYHTTFAGHFLMALEAGAKYRIYSKKKIAHYLPALSGIEPTLSLMFGAVW